MSNLARSLEQSLDTVIVQVTARIESKILTALSATSLLAYLSPLSLLAMAIPSALATPASTAIRIDDQAKSGALGISAELYLEGSEPGTGRRSNWEDQKLRTAQTDGVVDVV